VISIYGGVSGTAGLPRMGFIPGGFAGAGSSLAFTVDFGNLGSLSSYQLSFSSQAFTTSIGGGFAFVVGGSVGVSLSKDLPSTSLESVRNGQSAGILGDTSHTEMGISGVSGASVALDTAPGSVAASAGIKPEFGAALYSTSAVANNRTFTVSAAQIWGGIKSLFGFGGSSSGSPHSSPNTFTGTVGPEVVKMDPFEVTANKNAPNAPGGDGGSAFGGSGVGGGGLSAITIGGGEVITDPDAISAALAQVAGDPMAFGKEAKRKFEQENAR
jgi:hypothetical protein